MSIFLRLIKLLAPSWKSMLLATILASLTVGSNVGLLAASAYLISCAALHPPVLDLMPLIVGVRFFGISRAVFRYLERYVSHDVTFRILKEVRVWFYVRLEPLAPQVFKNYRSGELLSGIVADVETLKDFYLRVLAPPLMALLVLPVTFLFLARHDLKLGLALLPFFLLAGIGAPLGVRVLSRGIGSRMVGIKSALNAHLVDCIQGMTELAAFGQEKRHLAVARELGCELVLQQGKAAGLSGLSTALTGLSSNLALWSILVLSIRAVESGQLKGTYLAMLALAAFGSFEAIAPLPLAWRHLEESLAAARRLFQISDGGPAVPDSPEGNIRPQGYDLKVKNLSFRYDDHGPWVLQDINLELPAGKRVAVVGPSGAGKSTLVNLLLRFWDCEEGTILLGGRQLKDYPQEEVRRLFSVVSQHTYLFNVTVRENLLLARPTASQEEMFQAAREARIHEFIQSLPQGYDTYVGEGGFKLSGGQRQRVAIARALLRNAPILVLDEVTTGLDAVTEREVWEALRNVMQGRTTLVITHHLAGLEDMDEIIVLQGGRAVERGTEQELLKQGGLYRQMWELQHQVLR